MATWTATNLISYDSYEDNTDVVYAVEYTVSHTSGDTTASIAGRHNVDLSDLSSFTAYASLTHNAAINWVKTGLGAEEVTALETVVTSIVSEKNREGTTSGKPW
jgi:hypothetical protein